jgi:aromatic-L-amino-acid decarboxylase
MAAGHERIVGYECLKMTPEEFRLYGHQAIDWIAEYLAHPERYPVLPPVKPGQLTAALPAHGPERGEPMSDILADFERLIVPAATLWNHPGFLAYFANSATPEGILGELLAAALNGNGMVWKTSPAITELEQVTLRWLRQWTGLPEDWFGIIYDTASTSSMHAIAAARQAADPESRSKGVARGMVVYTSEQAHSSIAKGAIAVGIGHDNVRLVPVDAEFRMLPDALREMIERDLAAGLRPCCVAATVGTTSTTSVDPVPAIADICERYNLWLHVDAAYAGSAAVAPEFRWALAGCERADSLVTNPHKWLLTPADCSVFYTRRPDVLRRAFSLVPEYLRTEPDPLAVNMMDYGVPLGRRFRALKLWFILRSYGREGLAAVIREHVRLAQEFARQVDADPRFELAAPVPFSVVNFRYKGTDDDNRRILDRVNAAGDVFISSTVLNDRFTLHLAIGNYATTKAHVDRAWQLLQEAAAPPFPVILIDDALSRDRRILPLLPLLLLAQPAQDPAALGRKALDLLLAGNYPELSQMFTADMKKALPEEALGKIGAQIKSWGAVEKIGDPSPRKVGPNTIEDFPVKAATQNRHSSLQHQSRRPGGGNVLSSRRNGVAAAGLQQAGLLPRTRGDCWRRPVEAPWNPHRAGRTRTLPGDRAGARLRTQRPGRNRRWNQSVQGSGRRSGVPRRGGSAV